MGANRLCWPCRDTTSTGRRITSSRNRSQCREDRDWFPSHITTIRRTTKRTRIRGRSPVGRSNLGRDAVLGDYLHGGLREGPSPLRGQRGGRDIKRNIAKLPLMERTGWCKIKGNVFEPEPPPRLRRFGCFALSSYWRSHPSWPGGAMARHFALIPQSSSLPLITRIMALIGPCLLGVALPITT